MILFVCVACQKSATIKSLLLKHNEITDDGFIGLFEMLKSNSTLTALDLQGNPNLNLRGAKALIDLLLVNPRWEVPDGHHTPTKSRAGTSIYFHSCVLASSSASC